MKKLSLCGFVVFGIFLAQSIGTAANGADLASLSPYDYFKELSEGKISEPHDPEIMKTINQQIEKKFESLSEIEKEKVINFINETARANGMSWDPKRSLHAYTPKDPTKVGETVLRAWLSLPASSQYPEVFNLVLSQVESNPNARDAALNLVRHYNSQPHAKNDFVFRGNLASRNPKQFTRLFLTEPFAYLQPELLEVALRSARPNELDDIVNHEILGQPLWRINGKLKFLAGDFPTSESLRQSFAEGNTILKPEQFKALKGPLMLTIPFKKWTIGYDLKSMAADDLKAFGSHTAECIHQALDEL